MSPAAATAQSILPPLLQPGDRIHVVAPAGPVNEHLLDNGLAWLRSRGFEVTEADGLRQRGGHGLAFLAGSDDQRRSDLVDALLDPGVRAIIAGRGGDGTPRLVDDLPWSALADTEPTIVAGLSDLTCLHQALASRLGWASLWSPMPGSSVLSSDHADEWSRANLLQALTGHPEPLTLTGSTLRLGSAAGSEPVTAPLVGGTLALLSAMVGTPAYHPARGGIAIVEDVGERPYRLERFLTHLRRAGFFDGCLGVAVGDLTDCNPEHEVDAVLRDFAAHLDVPVVTGLSFGHGPRQASLWLGRNATLDPMASTLTQRRD